MKPGNAPIPSITLHPLTLGLPPCIALFVDDGMSLTFRVFDWRRELAMQRTLFSESFPENAGSAAETTVYYHRKFQSYPGVPTSFEFVAEDSSGLVGYYAALPYTYQMGHLLFRCGMVCDVMTSPRMQGKGVFTKLGAYSLQSLTEASLDFVSGYPRRPTVLPGHLKVGWQVAFKLPLYLAPLKANAILRTRNLGWLAPCLNPGLTLWQRLLSLKGAPHLTYRIVDLDAFLAEYDYPTFLSEWASKQKVSLQKTSEFLRWRLSIQPVDYRITAVSRGNRLVGMSIVRSCEPEKVPSLAILDLMTLEDGGGVTSAMRLAWLELAGQWRCEALLVMMSEHSASKVGLQRHGFLKTPTTFSFILKRLSERAQAHLPTDTRAWNLMWIDSDDL